MNLANLLFIVGLCVVMLCGCSLALPLAGAGSAINSEYRVRKLERQVKENNKAIDYLLEQQQKQTIK